ncbi:hypothetical protein F4820DRAFT_442048 [Hypoxylon rubiginosum]|uniref:Uncharacterized protein n=1 Tax=Hypoxylon rubiginosum TaxID=110542 RepID=A0ACB9YI75_9PEZI|nr:hypothetical protein F4820DRAFT_442048 [Hypoxylon rubiginosum]
MPSPTIYYNDLWACRRLHGANEWCNFVVPQALRQTPLSNNQDSDLLRLPNEILLLIFSYSDPFGKLFLALTCKQLLSLSTMTTWRIPSAGRHHANLISGCPGMLGLQRVLVPQKASRKRKNTASLCCDCYRYQPRKESYWERVRESFPFSDEACRYLKGYHYKVGDWCHPETCLFQCPGCWCEERTRLYG